MYQGYSINLKHLNKYDLIRPNTERNYIHGNIKIKVITLKEHKIILTIHQNSKTILFELLCSKLIA